MIVTPRHQVFVVHFFIRRQTTSGLSGRSVTRTPRGDRASSTALAIAAGEGMDAPSPAAFCPNVVKGEGTGG